MFNLSSAMAGEFVKIANEMVDLVNRIGPNPLKSVEMKEGIK